MFSMMQENVLEPPSGPHMQEEPMGSSAHEVSDGGGGKIAFFSVALFLLACGYAAVSGYLLSFRPSVAGFGILGAVAALMAAGIGIGMAVANPRSPRGMRFLGHSCLWLALWFGLMVLLCMK